MLDLVYRYGFYLFAWIEGTFLSVVPQAGISLLLYGLKEHLHRSRDVLLWHEETHY